MYKNKLLMASIVLGNIPKAFFDLDNRFKLSLFSDRVSRIDFFFMYYTNALNFLLFAFCIHYNKYIDKRISRLVLIICSLDFLHLLLFAKQGLGGIKLILAMIILIYEYRKETVAWLKDLYYNA